jgi:DNA-binding transcriptional LysR family regulator
MELDHVEAFLAIARSGGFARGSAVLHLSQPATSRRIKLLEAELGAPLFERLGRGAILTEAGHAFLPHAQALVASMRDGVAAVNAVRGTGQGAVTLALVGTLASSSLTVRLRQLCQQHPGLDLRLRTALSAEVSALVLRGDAALGLRYGADPDPGLMSVIIHHERMVPVCPPGHPLAAGESDLGAFAGQRWLAFPAHPGTGGGDPYSALQLLLAAHGLGDAEILPIDSLTAQKRMVEAGFGLAIVQESSIEEELRTGTLCTIDAPALTATIPVALIRRRNAFQTGAARALTAALTDWPREPTPAGLGRLAGGGERACLDRLGHRGGPAGDAELGAGAQQVRLHGGLAEVKPPRDLRVGEPARDQPENLRFPGAELLRPGRGGLGAHPAHQAAGHRGREHGLAPGRGPHPVGEHRPGRVLQQVPGRAGLDRAQDVGVGVIRGQHHDRGTGQVPDGFHPIAARHPQVHEDDVRTQPPGERHRLRTGRRLADHLDVRLGRQHAPQALADDRVVVGQQDPDHAGTIALTRVPAPGALSTVSVPPASLTRVRIPSSP